MTAVLVPIFKPALLPASATLGAADVQRMPFTDDFFRHRIESQFGFAASTQVGYPTIVNSLTPVLPGPSMDNMQFAYRVASSIGEQDVAFSYYVGRTDFPQPFSNHTKEVDYVNTSTGVGGHCDPEAPPKNCINGVLATDVAAHLPAHARLRLQHDRRVQPLQAHLRGHPRRRLPRRGRAHRPAAHHHPAHPEPPARRAPAGRRVRLPGHRPARRQRPRRRREHPLPQVDAGPRLHLRIPRLRQRPVGPRPRRRVRRRRLDAHRLERAPERREHLRRQDQQRLRRPQGRHPVRHRDHAPPPRRLPRARRRLQVPRRRRPAPRLHALGPLRRDHQPVRRDPDEAGADLPLALPRRRGSPPPSTRSSTTTSATGSSSAPGCSSCSGGRGPSSETRRPAGLWCSRGGGTAS